MGRVLKILKALVHIDKIADQTKNLEEQNARRAEEALEISAVIGNVQTKIDELGRDLVSNICSDRDALSVLKKELSISPTIWGDMDRLHISPKAAVQTALFNLNSGEIIIGEGTFTGSNVSFLTGSHDMNLTGLLRRDCQIKEGNDIYVGKGVWIASNATIIGPCRIEDDAVIAAGAVVVPDTIVKRGEVYGGVPAKKIAQIRADDKMPDGKSFRRALEREEGLLFIDGWSDKRYVSYEDHLYEGHLLLDDYSVLYTNKKNVDLFYEVEDDDPTMSIEINENKYDITQRQGTIVIKAAGKVVIKRRNSGKQLFIGRRPAMESQE